MKAHDKHLFTKRSLSAYACIAASLVLVLFLGAWGVFRDLKLVRQSVLQAEVAQVNSHAIRTVGWIEHELDRGDNSGQLSALRGDEHLRRHWQEMTRGPQKRGFAAIIDPSGLVVAHSRPALEGRRLERDWYEKVVKEAGRDVFETASSALSDGELVYSVRVPIVVNDTTVGEYHTGFSVRWFLNRLKAKRSEILGHWVLLLCGILLIVVLASISLYYIARNSLGSGRALGLLKTQRAAELRQFAGGLAHEIRNPLHAIRLNLHTLARALAGAAKMDQNELETIVDQTNQEIERVDGLLQEMLGFATPGDVRPVGVDVVEAARSTLRFVERDLEGSGIEVHGEFPERPVIAHIDPDRFRQILLNLVINAKDALRQGGRLELRVRQRGRSAEVAVSDNGPGVPANDRTRIFEPFYSTKEHGSGLGLALVRRFVEDLGGKVRCEAGGNGCGTTFRIEIPRHERKGARHVDSGNHSGR